MGEFNYRHLRLLRSIEYSKTELGRFRDLYRDIQAELRQWVSGKVHNCRTVTHRRVQKIRRRLYDSELSIRVKFSRFDSQLVDEKGLLPPTLVQRSSRFSVDV